MTCIKDNMPYSPYKENKTNNSDNPRIAANQAVSRYVQNKFTVCVHLCEGSSYVTYVNLKSRLLNHVT